MDNHRKNNFASDSIAEAPHSDKNSRQDYLNTPKSNRRIPTDAPIEIDGTSNVRHDSALRHDTDSTTSTEVNIPTNHNDEIIKNENFPRGGKDNLRPDPDPNFSDAYR